MTGQNNSYVRFKSIRELQQKVLTNNQEMNEISKIVNVLRKFYIYRILNTTYSFSVKEDKKKYLIIK